MMTSCQLLEQWCLTLISGDQQTKAGPSMTDGASSCIGTHECGSTQPPHESKCTRLRSNRWAAGMHLCILYIFYATRCGLLIRRPRRTFMSVVLPHIEYCISQRATRASAASTYACMHTGRYDEYAHGVYGVVVVAHSIPGQSGRCGSSIVPTRQHHQIQNRQDL